MGNGLNYVSNKTKELLCTNIRHQLFKQDVPYNAVLSRMQLNPIYKLSSSLFKHTNNVR